MNAWIPASSAGVSLSLLVEDTRRKKEDNLTARSGRNGETWLLSWRRIIAEIDRELESQVRQRSDTRKAVRLL